MYSALAANIETEQEVKLRAKSQLLRGAQSVHTDDLFDIDHHIHLEPTADAQPFEPSSAYHIIPEPVIAAYAKSRNLLEG
jgi:hypothetical protein